MGLSPKKCLNKRMGSVPLEQFYNFQHPTLTLALKLPTRIIISRFVGQVTIFFI